MKSVSSHYIQDSIEDTVNEIINSVMRRPSNKFKCDQCLKYFSSKHCLKEHNYTHTNEVPYSCLICLRKFKHASQLSLHKKKHDIKGDPVWPKLTQLLSLAKETKKEPLTHIQIDDLPLIAHPQTWTIPKFNF